MSYKLLECRITTNICQVIQCHRMFLTVIILCLRLPYHLKCHRHDQKKINRSEVLPDGCHGQRDDDHTQGSELHRRQVY